MGIMLSPGVTTREVDLSIYPNSTSTSVCSMVGTASKGPVNVPTLITNPEQFIQTFGNPVTTSYLGYASLAFLENGNQLWVNRVGATVGTDKLSKAEVTLKDGTACSITAAIPGSYILAADEVFKVIINGTSQQIIYIDAATYSATQLANIINRQISGAYADASGTSIRITSVKRGSLSTIEVTDINNVLFNFANVTAATKTGVVDGPFTITASSNDMLKLLINGVNDVTIPLTAGVGRAATAVALEINGAIAAYGAAAVAVGARIKISSTHSGSGTSIKFETVVNSAYLTFGFIEEETVSGTSTITAGTTTATDILTFTALNEGTWGNNINVSITGAVDYSILASPVDKFNVNIYYSGVLVEGYQNCLRDSSNAADSNYVETLINGVSKYVTIVDVVANAGLPKDLVAANSTGNLVGGKNGIQGVLDADYIGVAWDDVLQKPTGLFVFANPEKMDINIIAVPGISSSAVIGNMLQLCTNRADCMAIIDPPMGLSAQEVVNWHNNVDGGGNALNSSYGALYHAWLKIYDSFNKTTVMVPPSGYVAGVYAKNDFLAESWYAPAGLNRGRILTVIDTESSPSQGERDLEYGGTNAVNPIVNFITDGITVWGQKTLLRTSTALNRVNVRRLMLYLRKVAARTARSFVFQPNTPALWKQVTGTFNSLMSDIQSRGGVTAYRVVCDATINTPERIDRNELWVRIFVKPVKAVEFIMIEFVLLPTGASLENETIV